MRKLLLFVCGFAAAVMALAYFFSGILWLISPVFGVISGVLFLIRNTWCRRFAVACLGIAAGAAWCSYYSVRMNRNMEGLCGETIAFRGEVADNPLLTSHGVSLTADIDWNGKPIRTILYFSDSINASPGDQIYGTGRFERAPVRFSEGQDLYEISNGIVVVGDIESLSVVPVAEPSFRAQLLRFAYKLKQNLYAVFSGESAGYHAALTMGDRSGISYAFRQRLAISGIYHAVSLSGMHISILMGTVYFCFFRRKAIAACVGIPLIILFCVASGCRPPTIRACVMQIILLSGLFLNREYDSLTSLATALLVLLLENPWSVSNWGLQLSFVSTAGILLLMPRFLRLPIKNKLVGGLLTPVFVTLSASVFSAPLMSVYFEMNSLVAPLTNLLALWAVTCSFVLGIAISLLAFLSVPLASIIAIPAEWLFRWVRFVVRILSDIPAAAVYSQTPLLLAWSYLAYLLVAAMFLGANRRLATASAGLTLVLALCLTPRLPSGMTVLDVGQGQSILFWQDGDAVLVDCGAHGDGTGENVARFLLSHGIRKLDALVLTHFDADHCNGVCQLMDRVSVKQLYFPKTAEQTKFQKQIMENGSVVEMLETETVVNVPVSSMKITVYPAEESEIENDAGLCVLASGKECDILVTGDMGTHAEARLLSLYDFPDLEVLVAGHHGSENSTGYAILDALRPETVLISVGESTYGLPSQSLLDRVASFGAAVYSTKENGNLTVRW